MKNILRLLLLVGLFALGYWAWTVFFPSPEKVIRQHLVKLAELASFNSNEGNVAKIASIQRIGTFFAEDIEVAVDAPGIESFTFNRREDLTTAAMGARSVVKGLKVNFVDINVTLGPDKLSAVAELTMEAKIPDQKDLIIQMLQFTVKKIDGHWLITRIEPIKALR